MVRKWGRIGRAGRLRMVAYESAAAAWDALARQRRVKERRGIWRCNGLDQVKSPKANRSAPSLQCAPESAVGAAVWRI